MMLAHMRASKPEEQPRLRQLWKLAFGDSDEYIDCFFQTCPDPERVMVLVMDGDVRSMAAWFEMPFVAADGTQCKGAYVYAVATDPAYRGRGFAGKLLEWMGGVLWSRGYEGLTTVPASERLHSFFAGIGFEEAFSIVEREVVPDTSLTPAPLSVVDAEQYGVLREAQLAGRAHVACGEWGLAYQQAVCSLSGGGLFRAGSGCVCVERAGDTAVVKELLAPEEEHPAILSALARTFNAERWVVRTPCQPGQEGRPFAMYRWTLKRPEEWPAEQAYFGLAFD